MDFRWGGVVGGGARKPEVIRGGVAADFPPPSPSAAWRSWAIGEPAILSRSRPPGAAAISAGRARPATRARGSRRRLRPCITRLPSFRLLKGRFYEGPLSARARG